MKLVSILSVLALLGPVTGAAQAPQLIAESQPVVLDAGSAAYMFTFMPRLAGGTVILEHRAGPSEPAYSIYSRDGKLQARFRIDLPDASETIDSRIAPLRDGSGFVAGAIAVNGLDRAFKLCFLDRDGKLKKVVPISPYWPTHLAVAADGTIWGFGSASRDDKPASDNPVVFHVSSSGELLGTALPRKLFGSEPPHELRPESGPAFLASGGSRVAVYSPQTRQLFELGLDRKVIGSYVIPLPEQQRAGQSLARPMGLAGLAITDQGTIYAKLNGGDDAGLYELDRPNQRWTPLPEELMNQVRAYSLIGCQGEDLALTPAGRRGQQFPVKWIRLTPRFTP
ncbi:MAG TPA: hypothetical protein VLE22_24005 [Bryobacteraceae bacterium]|nr:hypothetical protein [Bryobacteraceae bacterium]